MLGLKKLGQTRYGLFSQMITHVLNASMKATAPNKRSLGLIWSSLTVYLISFVLIALARPQELNPYDEGLVLVGALRVMAGEIPYRDFWTMYGPGQFYFLAALMSLFGKYAIVERLYECAIRAAIVLITFLVIRRFSNQRVVGFALSGILALLASTGSDGFPVFPALVFAMAAFLLTIRSFEGGGSSVAIFCAGLCTGIAALFRHDLGLYALMTCATGLTTAEVLHGGRSWSIIRSIAKSMAFAASGCAIVIMPLSIILIFNVSLYDLYQNLIEIPLHVYPNVRRLPFPSLLSYHGPSVDADLRQLVVYVPFLIVAVTAMAVIASFTANRNGKAVLNSDRSVQAATVMFVVGTALFAIKGLVRISPEHMVQSVICGIVTITLATRLRLNPQGLPRVTIWIATGLTSIVLAAFGVQSVRLMATNAAMDIRTSSCISPPTPAIRCFTVNPDIARVVQYLQSHTSPDEKIYVGPGLHDKIFVNDIIIYFAAQRLPGTKWHDSHPGVQTARTVQTAMIKDLQRENVNIIVEDRAYDDVIEPNDSQYSSGVKDLDLYISHNFLPVFVSGTLTIYERRS